MTFKRGPGDVEHHITPHHSTSGPPYGAPIGPQMGSKKGPSIGSKIWTQDGPKMGPHTLIFPDLTLAQRVSGPNAHRALPPPGGRGPFLAPFLGSYVGPLLGCSLGSIWVHITPHHHITSYLTSHHRNCDVPHHQLLEIPTILFVVLVSVTPLSCSIVQILT